MTAHEHFCDCDESRNDHEDEDTEKPDPNCIQCDGTGVFDWLDFLRLSCGDTRDCEYCKADEVPTVEVVDAITGHEKNACKECYMSWHQQKWPECKEAEK